MGQQTDSAATSKLDAMRAAIDAEKQARQAACWDDIKAVIKKHRCVLDAVPQFVGSAGVFSVVVQIRVSARED